MKQTVSTRPTSRGQIHSARSLEIAMKSTVHGECIAHKHIFDINRKIS